MKKIYVISTVFLIIVIVFLLIYISNEEAIQNEQENQIEESSIPEIQQVEEKPVVMSPIQDII